MDRTGGNGDLLRIYLNDPPKMVHRSTFLVEGLGRNDIIYSDFEDTTGNVFSLPIVIGSRFETEYQGRLYVADVIDALNSDGNIYTDCMLEVVAEAFRLYMNGNQISNEARKLIEDTIL